MVDKAELLQIVWSVIFLVTFGNATTARSRTDAR